VELEVHDGVRFKLLVYSVKEGCPSFLLRVYPH